jgi:hypothetical protein
MNGETMQSQSHLEKVGDESSPPEENPKHHGPTIVTDLMQAFGWTYSRANRFVAVAVESFDIFGELAEKNPASCAWLSKTLNPLNAKCAAAGLDADLRAIKESYAVADAATQPALVRLDNNETPETLKFAIGKLRQESRCNAELTAVLEKRRLELVS